MNLLCDEFTYDEFTAMNLPATKSTGRRDAHCAQRNLYEYINIYVYIIYIMYVNNTHIYKVFQEKCIDF